MKQDSPCINPPSHILQLEHLHNMNSFYLRAIMISEWNTFPAIVVTSDLKLAKF